MRTSAAPSLTVPLLALAAACAPASDAALGSGDAAVEDDGAVPPVEAGPEPDDEGEPSAWAAEPIDVDADTPPAAFDGACVARPEPAPAAGCPYPLEVIIWASHAWTPIAAAFAENESPCAEYWVSVPGIAGEKTRLRTAAAADIRARSPRVHAMAELQWHAWNDWRAAHGVSWREVGHEFRRRMADVGYCVESGDTWVINEVPTSVRTNTSTRAGFEDLVLGLYEGAPGMEESRGAALVWNMGHATRNMSLYRPSWRAWLADTHFWERMNRTVRFWGQEAYVDPRFTCVPGSTLDARADRISEFTMHPARLAAAAPDAAHANAAEIYFGRAYFPLLNGVWWSAPENGYGDTRMAASEMADHVSEQVYATRRWADSHATPDGRIGFAYASRHDPPDWDFLAAEIARATRNAYGRGNGPAAACWADGRRARCTCSVPGAQFNPAWSVFGSW